MKRSDAFPSTYVGKDDLEQPTVLTIGNVVQEEIESDGTVKLKAVMHFTERDAKPWIVNAGNWMTIEDVYGEESDDWTGKRVELFVDATVMFGGKRVGGVRVRIPAGTAPAQAPQHPAPQEQVAEIDIQTVEVVGDWYIVTSAKGSKYGTQDAELGKTIQSWGRAVAALVYTINPQGKNIIQTATLAGEPLPF